MASTPNDKKAASSCASEQRSDDDSKDEVTDFDDKEITDTSVVTDAAAPLAIDCK
jgi:hypothetical protein